jgi:NADH:ubiquinone oxidoreductase subunit F (NADH-binding)
VGELIRLQESEGWLSEESLRELAARLGVPLHRLESVSTFYTHFRRTPPRRLQVDVCRDLACSLAGGDAACAQLREALASRDDVEINPVSCLGRCDRAPAAALGQGVLDTRDTESAARAIESQAVPAATRSPARWDADPYANAAEHYSALRDALSREASGVVAGLDEAGLRGMGGAGFPTARKWSLVAAESSSPKHVVCNADESEPGAFKDREILSDLPHLVIEGMALAGFCTGSARGIVFIRHEYGPERLRLEAALDAARVAGALGRNVFGTGFDFEIDVFVSPGGYILGEETALLECLEDRRGEPRNKPPFPGQRGLHGRPTLVNNVETFAHAAAITRRGAAWWKRLGQRGRSGHKFISVSGDVARRGVVLIPFGTTLGELLEICGGMRDGAELAAVAPGGASSNFLPADRLDVPIDFDSLSDAGSMLGSGAAVFIAAGRDLLEVGLNVVRFFRNESCGKCVPCRLGTEKAVKLVEGSGPAGARALTTEDLAMLAQLDATLRATSICGLGQVALGPLRSVLERFPRAFAGS